MQPTHVYEVRPRSDAALAALIAKYERDAPYNIAFVYAIRWRTSTRAISASGEFF
jgi:hypothetical protein